MKLDLNTLALTIFKICYQQSIRLNIECFPRDCITRADFISKRVISKSGRSLRMFSKSWIVSGVPIEWIVSPHITTERSPDTFLDFGTRRRRASMYFCSRGK